VKQRSECKYVRHDGGGGRCADENATFVVLCVVRRSSKSVFGYEGV